MTKVSGTEYDMIYMIPYDMMIWYDMIYDTIYDMMYIC